MQPLSAAKIKQHLDSAKGKGDLVKAYRIAQDPSEWRDQREEINAEYHRLQAAAAEDQDELESDHEATGAKRKRKSDAAGGKKAGADKKAKISQPAKSKARPRLHAISSKLKLTDPTTRPQLPRRLLTRPRRLALALKVCTPLLRYRDAANLRHYVHQTTVRG